MGFFVCVFLLGIFVCDFCLEAVSLGTICLLWVFLLAFHALRPRYGFPRLLFYSHAQFPLPDISISFRGGLSRLLFFSYAHAVGFPAYFFCSHAQVNIFIKRNYEFSVIKSCIPFTKQHIYATLNTTRLSSLSASYFIQKICFTIQIFTHPHRLHFTVLSDNSTCFRIKPAI